MLNVTQPLNEKSQAAFELVLAETPTITKYNLPLLANYSEEGSQCEYFAFDDPEDNCVLFYYEDMGIVSQCHNPPYALLKLINTKLSEK